MGLPFIDENKVQSKKTIKYTTEKFFEFNFG
ncbi:hypothetical protein SAMN03080594_10136 [Arenibacter palladensis]|uniref:Uncharacterized protein n=1 Tax=Arenibacter palladensis TaxID=237373 RepID=A0A1M4SUT5_9FLAO|nr:hypothetical protein SAMN03080594_10136 [Arenibacter palladensis]